MLSFALWRPFSITALSSLTLAQTPATAPAGQTAPGEGDLPVVAESVQGERVPASAIGPGRFVNLLELSRQQERQREEDLRVRRERNGAPGEWVVPSLESARSAHSGRRYVMNKWGDTRMGIDFAGRVDLSGAWIAAQTSLAVSTDGLRVIGMRGGVEVARTEWFEEIGETPAWFAMDLEDIDRAVFEARSAVDGAGWFALDDLTFRRGDADVVLDFETLDPKVSLTGTGYGGLVWELGSGDFTETIRSMPPPRGSRAPAAVDESLPRGGSQALLGGGGTPPAQIQNFAGTRMFDIAASAIPPDTCGAVGIDHYVLVTNSNISVYEKAGGTRVVNAGLAGFFNIGGSGDPRVVFDPNSQRWFVISTNFNTRIYVAASMTSDPTGMWFASFFVASSGSDAGAFPDYPTLGVNHEGVFIGAAMFGSAANMTMFAIDKAPLISTTPALGTITAFRGFQFDGALQPCVTYGMGDEYFISRRNSNSLRLRRINGPMTAPTFTGFGGFTVGTNNEPPNAPALGSTTPIDTVGSRLMNAVFRHGSIWTAQAVNAGGRSAVRWYEIDPLTLTVVQSGTVSDPERWYYMPSIAVNSEKDVLVGFSGSNANEYAGAYVAGRRSTDPPGEMSPAQLMREGLGPYTRLDGGGRNRWGDYSLTSVDPVDELTLWTRAGVRASQQPLGYLGRRVPLPRLWTGHELLLDGSELGDRRGRDGLVGHAVDRHERLHPARDRRAPGQAGPVLLRSELGERRRLRGRCALRSGRRIGAPVPGRLRGRDGDGDADGGLHGAPRGRRRGRGDPGREHLALPVLVPRPPGARRNRVQPLRRAARDVLPVGRAGQPARGRGPAVSRGLLHPSGSPAGDEGWSTAWPNRTSTSRSRACSPTRGS